MESLVTRRFVGKPANQRAEEATAKFENRQPIINWRRRMRTQRMPMFKFSSCMLVVCLSSCSSYEEPYLNLRVDFDPTMVDAAKHLLTETARSKGWRVDEKIDQTPGGHAELSVFVFPHDEAVRQQRWLLYARSAKRSLSVHVYDYGDVSLKDLDTFARQIEVGLERVTGSGVCREHTRKGYCDEPKEPLIRYKARFVPGMVTETAEPMRTIQRSWPYLQLQDFSPLMEEITGRTDSFESLLFYDSPSTRWKKALKIGNSADGRYAILELYQVSGMSAEEVNRLADQSRSVFETHFGSPFCRIDHATDLCGAELAERKAGSDLNPPE